MSTDQAQRRRTPIRGGFADPGHDHAACVADALAAAERVAERRGVRLTEQRRRVLQLVWESHAPVGAYDLLDRLRDDGRKAAPPTVYRALEFLVDLGLVHRIESLNAYVGCGRPLRATDGNPDEGDVPVVHSGQFLICRRCGTAAEIHDDAILDAIGSSATAVGFEVDATTVEVVGLCPGCADTPAGSRTSHRTGARTGARQATRPAG